MAQQTFLTSLLELASNLTYAQTIKRDMFQQRISEGRDLYLHEFLYPLMQGYDSVAMDVDGEVGGNDQTFNMLVGRDLLKKIKNKEKFVITSKLLEDTSGKKMGKTEGNMVTLSDAPNEMFGKIMSWPDTLIPIGLELLTFLPMNEVKNLVSSLTKGVNPKEVKSRLAFEVVKIYHNAKAAEGAVKNFNATFKAGAIPENVLTVKTAPDLLSEVLLKAKMVESKTEFRRLVSEGAIEDLDGKTRISNPTAKVEKTTNLKIGKKRFIKIEVEK
jgi:tyrosyl-tRNA synthetase